MKTVVEIREMFEALKQQRDESVDSSYRISSDLYVRALAWVLKDPQVKTLLLSKETKAFK